MCSRNLVIYALTAVFVAGHLFAACSVKEDRDDCPCRLILDFPAGCAPGNEVDLDISGNGYVIDTTIVSGGVGDADDGQEFSDSVEFVEDIRKGRVVVNAWHPSGLRFRRDSGFVIAAGEECPPIWLHSFIVDAYGESVRRTVALHKNYCLLTISMSGDPDDVDLRIFGNYVGYGRNAQVLGGRFDCQMRHDAREGDWEIRLPRQLDSSLRLLVSSGNGASKVFAIGEYITGSGYDWDAPDLDDIEVEMDYASASVTFKIDKWTETVSFEVVI